MKKMTILFLVAACILASCKSTQVVVPSPLKDNAEKFHVVNTGVSLIGHKIKIEGFGEARMYSGFSIGTSDLKRWLPSSFNLDRRMKQVSGHFQHILDVSRTQYHFDLVSNDIYVNTYCVATSAEGSLNVKDLDTEMGMGSSYRFEGLIFTNKDTTPWKLRFDGSKTQKYDAGNYLKNVRHTDGTLTNDTETIDVTVVMANNPSKNSRKKQNLTKAVTGYEFRLKDTSLAFVDIRNRNIYVSKKLDAYTRAVIVAAAISLLVKTNTA